MGKNKKLSEKEVKHIAKLANLPLTSEETVKFQNQLSETLDYVEILNSIETKGVKPTNQVTGLSNITRTDKTSPSLSQEETLKNAKVTYNGFIKVKAIFNE